MTRDCLQMCEEFFAACAKKQEAAELLREIGDRVAQFIVEGEHPFYVQLGKDGVVSASRGTAKQADITIETSPAACEEIFKPWGTSFVKACKEVKIRTRPYTLIGWFGMLVRIGQGR